MTTPNVPVATQTLAFAFLAEAWPFCWGDQQMSREDFEAVKSVLDAIKTSRLDAAAFIAGQNDVAFRFWMHALDAIEAGKVKN